MVSNTEKTVDSARFKAVGVMGGGKVRQLEQEGLRLIWKDQPLWYALIRHDHGYNLTLHSKESEAYHALYSYVKQWWSEEFPDEEIPGDPESAIAAYFERVEHEEAVVDQAILDDPDFPDGANYAYESER